MWVCIEKTKLVISIVLFFIFTWVNTVFTKVELQYQNRGNRYEGIKPNPVSGYSIELISVRVDYKEEVEQISDTFKVKFYLEEPSEVYLTIRELDYTYYYWMDKVQPAKPWQRGFDNVFAWPTQDVIQKLSGLKMYDLGVVARVKHPGPRMIEDVVPVIFYHSRYPATIEGYLFTFKITGDARL